MNSQELCREGGEREGRGRTEKREERKEKKKKDIRTPRRRGKGEERRRASRREKRRDRREERGRERRQEWGEAEESQRGGEGKAEAGGWGRGPSAVPAPLTSLRILMCSGVNESLYKSKKPDAGGDPEPRPSGRPTCPGARRGAAGGGRSGPRRWGDAQTPPCASPAQRRRQWGAGGPGT